MRHWSCRLRVYLLSLLFLLVLTGGARAQGQFSLAGLETVRVQVAGDALLDPVDVEVAVLRRLADEGIGGAADAAAVLAVDTRATADHASSGVALLEYVVLERNPMLTVRVPTWSAGEAARLTPGDDPAATTRLLLDQLLDQFITAWGAANP